MKVSQRNVVVGVVFVLLLLVYSVFTANRAHHLEKRLALMEKSLLELKTRHAALRTTVLQNKLSAEAMTQMQLELLREEMDLPPATSVPDRPITVNRNSPRAAGK